MYLTIIQQVQEFVEQLNCRSRNFVKTFLYYQMLKKLNTEPVMITDLPTLYSTNMKIKVKLVRNLEYSICDDDDDDLKEPSIVLWAKDKKRSKLNTWHFNQSFYESFQSIFENHFNHNFDGMEFAFVFVTKISQTNL